MAPYPIAVVIGSLRKDSLNKRLADAVTRLAPPASCPASMPALPKNLLRPVPLPAP